jgi:hypothetical protein
VAFRSPRKMHARALYALTYVRFKREDEKRDYDEDDDDDDDGDDDDDERVPNKNTMKVIRGS